MIGVGFQVDGQHHLVRLDGGGRRGLHDLFHPQGDGLADGDAAVLHRADHVDARLRGAGGVAVIEIVGIEVDAAGGDPGLVDAEDLPDILRVIAEAIIHAVAQAGGHLDSRLAHDGAAVLLEAHRVITGVAAAQ